MVGFKKINKAIYSIVGVKYINLQVIWQCGKLYYDHYKQKVISYDIKLFDFVDDIALAYSVSDFIISRSGAVLFQNYLLSESPIFIPSPSS